MANEIKILLAEDDVNLGFVIRDNLEQRGFSVHLCKDGAEALHEFGTNSFNLCLLDVMMPRMDGFTLAEAIRAINNQVPILFLTAKTLKEDRLRGFQLGGDDYITKPFSIEELILRIQVFLKRSGIQAPPSGDSFVLGSFIFEPKNLLLRSAGEDKALTRMEADILKFLCDRKNQVVTRKLILDAVWGNDDYFNGRSLDVFITRLRKILSKDSRVKITNHHGVGFMLALEDF